MFDQHPTATTTLAGEHTAALHREARHRRLLRQTRRGRRPWFTTVFVR